MAPLALLMLGCQTLVMNRILGGTKGYRSSARAGAGGRRRVQEGAGWVSCWPLGGRL